MPPETLTPQQVVEPGNHFVTGDEAIAYGALYAGCRFFAGYPITPASEIAETLSEELPKLGGRYVQMEDELGSIAAAIGSSWQGSKAMTSTSGPGFSLMQENLGYAVMTETPLVVVDIQRSGPSTGQATLPAQGDLQQARWGTHGDHPIIALTPASVQEAFELTVRAFNLADRYRTPVLVLADGIIGHASERLQVPQQVETVDRTVATEGDDTYFGDPDVAPMPLFGNDLSAHVTGSTHEPDGMRDVKTQSVHDSLVRGIHRKIESNRDRIIEYETAHTDEMDALVVSYGITGRTAEGAVDRMREEGHRVGSLRLKTVWPFPEETIGDLTSDVDRVFVPELSLGQLAREVEWVSNAPVETLDRIGGEPYSVDALVQEIGGVAT
ncbi:2-oxoglutarate/2-oxoacid ferredoxin oxidoreductase subunit alpha [Halalkaliarchaeum desulfuricum]|uniref:2-oxoglutarate synthase subunit KorA n=1 Tax=Halalkaliarchaeum desulfuricum TaxID=2055893 RepID=A0A343TLS5_9EURY|nr:2-oxoacid:acceptor oxidoreductase subunit alpha [Halalkaliarchaeum desulfuricum]AUX10047.1 2-oxoglutarate/2-oxoacid ferredoxin oxidoreductase subunit alpha [Halalkaliarchaeum desulfuricum]